MIQNRRINNSVIIFICRNFFNHYNKFIYLSVHFKLLKNFQIYIIFQLLTLIISFIHN